MEKTKNSDSQARKVIAFALIALAIVITISKYLPLGGTSTAQPTQISTPTVPTECAPDTIMISVVYSSEVDFYMKDIAKDFNQLSARGGVNPDNDSPLSVDGKPICVLAQPISAGTVRAGILNALSGIENQTVLRPTIWSPSVSHWLVLANQDAREAGHPELFDISQTEDTALAPVVIAIWQSRLDAIRNKVGYDDIGWEELLAVLTSPNGWCDYDVPDCREVVYYGHTNPYNSPTGLSTLISEFYASARANGVTDRTLTEEHVEDPQILLGVREIEALIRHYSDRTTEFKFYIAQGPDYVDFVALEENDVIYINQGHDPAGNPINTPPEPLVALYPKEGTFIHDHPFGILKASWVTTEQQQAAEVFTDYVLTVQVQKFIMSKGFRPAIAGVENAFPIDPVNGVDPSQPGTSLIMPDVETLRAIQESWGYVKKRADITLLIDVSGSMQAQNKIAQAQEAARTFMDNMVRDPMQHDSRIGLTIFNHTVTPRIPVGSIESSGTSIITEVNNLRADGGTALYDGLMTTITEMSQTDCDNRIRAIILLSDGADRDSDASLQTVNSAIEAQLETPCPILIIPVAYGSDAELQTLNSIARTSRTQTLVGTPDNIKRILDQIRSYF